MTARIHIVGASGSGTTTLGQALGIRLGWRYLDADDYFWLPSMPPFQIKRGVEDRISLLNKDLHSEPTWILSGSLCGWGDVLIPRFDLVLYLWIPYDLRMARLYQRELQRYGEAAIKKNGNRYEASKIFLEWAAAYDEAGLTMRSKALHEEWLAKLPCEVLRLEGDLTVEERVKAVLESI